MVASASQTLCLQKRDTCLHDGSTALLNISAKATCSHFPAPEHLDLVHLNNLVEKHSIHLQEPSSFRASTVSFSRQLVVQANDITQFPLPWTGLCPSLHLPWSPCLITLATSAPYFTDLSSTLASETSCLLAGPDSNPVCACNPMLCMNLDCKHRCTVLVMPPTCPPAWAAACQPADLMSICMESS